MSFTNSNDWITGRKPMRTPAGGEVCAERFTLSMAAGDLALNTIGQIGILPAGCVPVDIIVDFTDPDASTAALVMSFGIWDGSAASLSTATADGGGVWGVSQAATAAAEQRLTMTGNNMRTVTGAVADRKLGMKVTTAPTTAQACTLGVTLLYRAA